MAPIRAIGVTCSRRPVCRGATFPSRRRTSVRVLPFGTGTAHSYGCPPGIRPATAPQNVPPVLACLVALRKDTPVVQLWQVQCAVCDLHHNTPVETSRRCPARARSSDPVVERENLAHDLSCGLRRRSPLLSGSAAAAVSSSVVTRVHLGSRRSTPLPRVWPPRAWTSLTSASPQRLPCCMPPLATPPQAA